MPSTAVSNSPEIEEAENVADDDLLSAATTESRSATPEDLTIETISMPMAICLATVFEEMSDKLTLVGHSLPTPFADARTRQSIDISRRQRPVLKDAITSSTNIEEGWLLRQLHKTQIPQKLDHLVQPNVESRLSATDIMKRAGIKAYSHTERNQKIRIQMQLMANAVVNELVLDSSFDSLMQRIVEENREKELMAEKCNKIKYHQEYIQVLQTHLRDVRKKQVLQRKALRVDIHNMTDLLLEHNFRSNLEDKYVKKNGLAKVRAVRKTNNLKEIRKLQDFNFKEKDLTLEYQCHESMKSIIEQRLQENMEYLDTVVEKYDKDFTRLTTELEILIKARKRDLERISWLQKRIVDYERIVFDDRRLKDREADKQHKKLVEHKKAVKIQSWWRGIMVKRWLGSFHKLFTDLYEHKAMRAAMRGNQKGRFKPKK